MAILVQCVHCGARLKAHQGDAGKTMACPKCGNRVKVPLWPIAAAEPQSPADARHDRPAPPAGAQAAGGDAPQPAELPVVPDEPPHEAEAPSPPERFYGGDSPRPSPGKGIVALVIFVAGVIACVLILSRKANDQEEDKGPMQTVTQQTLNENRQLHERAISAFKNNDKEEALKLYRELVANLERYPPGYPSGLNEIKLELRAIETGRTVAELYAEERGETLPGAAPPQQPPPPQDTPPVQPDAQPDQQPDAEPAEQPDAHEDEMMR
ncbi:MAG TPA: hypothetical protein VM186_06205 [Planctomycetota bacterium]|nr:hypothetical protein [Planctomycetota bacterium]